jgi:hypothetical protein
MSHDSKTYTHVKQTASYTREDHGQPITFVTEYEWCDPTEEGAMPVSEMPADDYDDGGGLGAFRHYVSEITNEDRDFSPEPVGIMESEQEDMARHDDEMDSRTGDDDYEKPESGYGAGCW